MRVNGATFRRETRPIIHFSIPPDRPPGKNRPTDWFATVGLAMPRARKFLRGGRGAAMTVVVFSVNREHVGPAGDVSVKFSRGLASATTESGRPASRPGRADRRGC